MKTLGPRREERRPSDPLHSPVQKPQIPRGRASPARISRETPSVITSGTKGPAGVSVGFFCTEHTLGGGDVLGGLLLL